MAISSNIEDSIKKIAVETYQNGRTLEKVVLSGLDWESFLIGLGSFYLVRSEETLSKHCSTCKCVPHIFLHTPAGTVRIEKGTFTCAYIVWPGGNAKTKP